MRKRRRRNCLSSIQGVGGEELECTRPEGEFLAYQIGPDLEARILQFVITASVWFGPPEKPRWWRINHSPP
jgi:hypothetical protein